MLQQYQTQGGVHVEFSQQQLDYQQGITSLLERLDSHRGAVFTSGFEYPGRYTCWDIGFFNPPLAITCQHHLMTLEALNQRGEVLLSFIYPSLLEHAQIEILDHQVRSCQLQIKSSEQVFTEEERSCQPSVFSLIRIILALFKADEEHYLGVYGAFGFDLIHQFEELSRVKPRDAAQRDMVLYIPDELYVVNHQKEEAFIRRYDFQFQGNSTQSLAREGAYRPYQASQHPDTDCDHESGEYAEVVTKAKERFACGDLFEVVPSQTFYASYHEKPSLLYQHMCTQNPSPYGFFINLGQEEYLIGASPEMYVLLIDHQDSFVHTLANYFSQTGAQVTTVRYDRASTFLNSGSYDLAVLSPGPGKPSDFDLSTTIKLLIDLKIPIFGVCLGLQGLVEYFGGSLDVLSYPMHGKMSTIQVLDSTALFAGLGSEFQAGRYHSLHARWSTLPEELKITALSEDQVIMAISHQHLPIHAVQFHPETILSLMNEVGLNMIRNVIGMVKQYD